MLDSSAKVHCTTQSGRMMNITTNQTQVIMRDNRQIEAKQKGDLHLITKDGGQICLQDTRIIDGFHRNIISFPILMERGCSIVRACYKSIELDCQGITSLIFD